MKHKLSEQTRKLSLIKATKLLQEISLAMKNYRNICSSKDITLPNDICNIIRCKYWDCPVCREITLYYPQEKCNNCPIGTTRCGNYMSADTLFKLKEAILKIRQKLYQMKRK